MDELGELIDNVEAVVGGLDAIVNIVATVVIEDGLDELIDTVVAVVGTLDVVVNVVASDKDEPNDIIADVVLSVGGLEDVDIVGGLSPAPYSCCRSRKYSK